MAPGAPKPSKLLLHYSVELLLGETSLSCPISLSSLSCLELDRVALGGVGGLRTHAPSENLLLHLALAVGDNLDDECVSGHGRHGTLDQATCHLITFTLALATLWSRQPDDVCFDRGRLGLRPVQGEAHTCE